MRTSLVSMLVMSALAVAACKKSDAPAPGNTAAANSAVQTGPYADVFTGYEKLRASLAQDNTSGLGDTAGQLASAAEKAAGNASAAAKPHLTALAAASHQLHGAAGSNIDSARQTFGDISKHLLSLMAAEPSLQAGHHVFECPMAKGYKKWVQTKPGIENPYMGKQMLECGTTAQAVP